ncbi:MULTISPECIES: hypothetical protein [Desulfovibrio]|uniref:Uncharacterized protein n=1 Tax=Desulfovibrio desulfuricans TaxID=876 RepID=A0AA94HVJ2_DESDE|nr:MULTISPECIES: hypothetical protein [Desulfovibrio]ATD80677.1 hypothetical protein CNY67_04000 [Desulfovibrio sp. G11]SFW75553.1 hypothetical protein SAMN02910291_02928 [Desulfovibrio desulfuricans]SPD36192.1 Hypothetical protein DSVG11_2099 [Desulfovibrio sp. G11]
MKLKEKKYTACALISCNVSYKNEITEKKLLDILLGKEIPGKWIGHIDWADSTCKCNTLKVE